MVAERPQIERKIVARCGWKVEGHEMKSSRSEDRSRSLLEAAANGFKTVDAEPVLVEQALRFLGRWLTNEQFATYQPQLEWLIQMQQWAGLLDRFYQILPFGTGGRRGAVGIGPNRMNLWTLGASVQGHCDYLRERFPGIKLLRVVLAYDVRQFEDQRHRYNPALPNPVLHLSSKEFAHHAAGVYAANGIDSYILPAESNRYLATPELSFTIRYLRAQGGLNISASHNPPDDNGGKFYDERGGQPVPPDDQIMADLVDQVVEIRSLPWAEATHSGRVQFLDQGPHQAYIRLCLHQSLIPAPRRDEMRVVFTPLHGVGSMTAMEVLQEAGFAVSPVEEQMRPDGQFPNVTQTPNPEVPASMDRAVRTAQAADADLVLSTDPDADRLGAEIRGQTSGVKDQWPERVGVSGGWRFLTGHEIAALLTRFKLAELARQGRMPASPIVVKTEVTTSLVTRIARSYGAQVVDNLLVGFKYIADVLWHLEQEGVYEDVRGTPEDFVIGCEESHGILVTPQIRDKDAAGAALLLAELALDQKRQGRTVIDYLDAIYRDHGYFHNSVHNMVMSGLEGKEQMARMMDRLRAAPFKQIGRERVTEVEDLRDPNGRLGPIKGATDFASRNVLLFRLGEHARIALRPSGTEPKAKAYVEVATGPRPPRMAANEWHRHCHDADQRAGELIKDFLDKSLSLAGAQRSDCQ
jgi:phosphoglucomutase/phosphomannomutase